MDDQSDHHITFTRRQLALALIGWMLVVIAVGVLFGLTMARPYAP